MSNISTRTVTFNPNVQVVYANNAVASRQMNPDGGFYDAAMEMYQEDDDAASLDFDTDGGADGTFFDALQEQASGLGDIGNGNDYFQSLGYVF